MPEERSAAVIRQTKEIRDLITEREHLERCIEADLTDLGKEGEEFDRLFDEELARMEPYWTKAIVIGPEDD